MPNPTIRTNDLDIPFGELARQINTEISSNKNLNKNRGILKQKFKFVKDHIVISYY
jgi:hypothetical protein